MVFCADKDRLKHRASDFLAESRRLAEQSARFEAMAYDAEYSTIDHVRECDLCQGRAPPVEPTPLLAVI